MKSAFLAFLLCVLLLVPCLATASITASPVGSHSIVITQVYVPGGSSSAPYNVSYIELFNAGPVPVDLTDFTLQYQSATGSMGPTNTFLIGPNSEYTASGVTYPANPSFAYNNGFNGILQPGQYLLIQMPGQGSTGVALPIAADIVITKSINQTTFNKPSTSGGKFAVVHSFSGLYCGTNSTNPARSNTTTDPYHVLIGPMATDFYGYRSDTGTTPNCYEGNGPVYIKPDASISGSKNNVAAFRQSADGCPLDTNNNGNMDSSTTPPTFSSADFVMMKIGPGMSNGWQLHNSTSVMTNGDTTTIQSYAPTICAQSQNTVNPTVELKASLASDSTLAPLTKIQAGVDTQFLFTATITDGGTNPTSAIGYYITADLTSLGNSLVETSLATAAQRFGWLGFDPSFNNPQYQFPIPPEDPPPTVPPNPVTFTLHPSASEQGSQYTIPVTIIDDGQRKLTQNIVLEIVGSTPGAATLSTNPASVPAMISTDIDLMAAITDAGLYPAATSYTVIMDLTSIGGGSAVGCPETSTSVYSCHTTVTADAALVGGSYTIPVTITDDQGRTLTLTPAAIQIAVTAAPEPVANLVWSSGTGDFGNVVKGATSAAQTATLSNTGHAALTITSIAASGDFTATNNCPAALARSASCDITVTFTPTIVGTSAGTLTVIDDSHSVAGSQQTLSLTGKGTPPPPTAELSSATLAFGNHVVTTTSDAQVLTLTNNGGQVLSMSGLALTGTDKADFSYTTTCGASLAAGANCTFSITFKPMTAGDKTATLTMSNNAANSPQVVQFTGAGVDFPMSAVEGAATTLTITAGETATFNLQISPAGPFNGSVNLACATVIQGATCSTTPTTVNINGASVPFTLTITTKAGSTLTTQNFARPTIFGGLGSKPRGPAGPSGMLSLSFGLVGVVFVASGKLRKQWRGIALSLALLCSLVLSGCAGLKTSPWPAQPTVSTPAGTYPITVTATYGTVVRSMNVTLNVN